MATEQNVSARCGGTGKQLIYLVVRARVLGVASLLASGGHWPDMETIDATSDERTGPLVRRRETQWPSFYGEMTERTP